VAGPSVALDFDRADIEIFVRTVSEILGFNYVLAPDVRGTVTVHTVGRVPRDELFGVLLAILEVHGFTAIKAGELYKIVRMEGAVQRAVPTIIGPAADTARASDEIITHIVGLRFASAAELVALLQPLLSKGGHLTAHGGTNLLAITDVAANVRRALDIIRLVEGESVLDELQVIPIRFVDAAQLATILNQRRRPAAGPGQGAALIIAEPRSNSLLVQAPRHELELIRRLIGQVDAPVPGGRQVFVYAVEHARAKDLASSLAALYAGPATGAAPTKPPVRVIADEGTNAIIVTTSPPDWPEIEATIKELDRPPRQVVVEALVAEVTLTDETRTGIDWATAIGSARVISLTSTATTLLTTSSLLGPAASGLTVLGVAGESFLVLLNALASQTRVNVLSTASVLVSENQKASINVSDSVPIVTSQQVPIGGAIPSGDSLTAAVVGTQAVEYRDVGVILTVTPRVGEGGTVALDIKQEVNDVGAAEPPTGSRRIIKRELDASVVLLDNQTLVLGGLIRDRRATEERGVPFLKDIPILGALFRAKTQTIERSELLVLITPRVIGGAPAPGPPPPSPR
jgi:general secretion pathway protein D